MVNSHQLNRESRGAVLISTLRREGFTGLSRWGKAPPPKSAEVQGGSGHRENIPLTVAFAESYCLEWRNCGRLSADSGVLKYGG